MSFPAPSTVLHPESRANDGRAKVAASASAMRRFMVSPFVDEWLREPRMRSDRSVLMHPACHQQKRYRSEASTGISARACNVASRPRKFLHAASAHCRRRGSAISRSVHVEAAIRRQVVEDLADAMIFARLVEEVIGAERHALRAVLRECVVREDDHLRVRRAPRYQRAQHAEART